MRAKSAKREKREREAVARGTGAAIASGERTGVAGSRGREIVRDEKAQKVLEGRRLEEGGQGGNGAWRAGAQSPGKDRSVAPPALPVPIASFTI
jgi:hypothetical protein